ncbi:MAG: hypothetical protein WB810_12425 [Candidatus Cybelea sp.]
MIETLCAIAIVMTAACSAGMQAPPVGGQPSQMAKAISPDLRLRPPTLRFNLKDPKNKTEEVVGYEPGGSYHEDCSTLGIATISYESIRGHNAFFLITPTHEGRCEIGFDHSGAKKVKTKTLLVNVRL